MVHLNNFKCMDTGGGCQALYHELPNKYVIVVTNEDAQIPEVFMDPMTLGVYRSMDSFSMCDHIYMEHDIFLSSYEHAYNIAMQAIEDDSRIVNPVKLQEIHAVIVEYTLDDPKTFGHHSMQRELFNVKNEVWSIDSMTETLHRKLGHNNFTIHNIYI